MQSAARMLMAIVMVLMLSTRWSEAETASINEPSVELTIYSATTNNAVEGTIIANTWDPDDPLTISGRLWAATQGCEQENVVANADSVIVLIGPPDDSSSGTGHKLCGTTSYRRASSPGTDSNGDFSVTIDGGGVSFLSDPGEGYCGGRLQLLFKEGSAVVGRVWCGRQEDWSSCFPCDDAPAIYGVLASPDLNGDLSVDMSDLSAMAVYMTNPPTPISATFGWQANFNHSGNYVDASDISYFSGRMGKNCNSSKPEGGGGYQMDVRNLQVPELVEFLAAHSISKSQVVGIWEENGWTYDHQAAAAILAGQPVPVGIEPVNWGKVKTLYR